MGGLVDSWKSIQRVPRHYDVGAAMSDIMDTWFDANPVLESELLNAIGKDGVDPQYMESLVDDLRDTISAALDPAGVGVDTRPIDNDLYSTRIRAHLLEAWLALAEDPGLPICQWLISGAPAGLNSTHDCLDGLFPRVPDEVPEFEADDLSTDFETFVNYTGVEVDDDVFEVLKGYKKAGYLRMFDLLTEVIAFLVQKPVLTKVGSVKKEKTNPVTGVTKTKTRIVVDSKQAKTSKASKRTHKSNPPTATWTTKGFLGLMANSTYDPTNRGS